MKTKSKYLLISAVLMSFMTICSCNRHSKLEPLSAPHTSNTADNTENEEDNMVVGIYLFTYYSQKIYDSYSDSMKDVQISDFYPVDITKDTADIKLNIQVRGQYFDDAQAQMTYICLADGQLCDMTYNGVQQNYITHKYRVQEDIQFDYSLNLSGKSNPLVGITLCTDLNLPQTEEQWYDWSEKAHFMNGELISCTESADDNTTPLRQNKSCAELETQTYPLDQNKNESAYLKISDSAFESIDFSEQWSTEINSGNTLYLYCSVPSDNCSLFLFIDDKPADVFDGAYGMDITDNDSSEFLRTKIHAPEMTDGTHYAFLLMSDNNTMQLHKSAPILLKYGDES